MEHNYTPADGPEGTHMWTLKGPKGGIHIWARPNSAEWVEKWGERYIGGVERHSPAPVYDWDKAPHHENCFLLGGPCWHDGTSLYFSERIAPMLGDAPFPEWTHNFMRNELDEFYAQNFGDASP